MKARTLLLMCVLSLAGARAGERIPPLNGPDGWPFGPPDGHDLRRVPHKVAPAIPLPRPRPYVPEMTGAIRGDALNPVRADPPAAPLPEVTPLAAPEPQNASTSQPGSAVLGVTEQGAAGDTHRQTYTAETPKRVAVKPVKDNGGAAMPAVRVTDAGGGRVRIEAQDASVGQVLAALQESGFIRFSASDQLSRSVTGTYTGTLPQVLSRILGGYNYNYFLHVTASGTELHAVDASSDTNAGLTALRSGSSDNNAALPNGTAATSRLRRRPPRPFRCRRPIPSRRRGHGRARSSPPRGISRRTSGRAASGCRAGST